VRRLTFFAALALAGCGQHKPMTLDGGVLSGPLRATNLSHNHLSTCDDPNCGNGANPPLGGDHCPVWLNCGVYDSAQPKCNWIHNLEHANIVMLYNCDGCDALVQSLKDYQTANPDSVVTPDPDLPNKVAIAVWGFGWIGDAFDAGAFDEVLTHKGEESPEHIPCTP